MSLPGVRVIFDRVGILKSSRTHTFSSFPFYQLNQSHRRKTRFRLIDIKGPTALPSAHMNASTPTFHSRDTDSTQNRKLNSIPNPLHKPAPTYEESQPVPARAAKIVATRSKKGIEMAVNNLRSSSRDRRDPIVPPSKASGGRPNPSAAYLAASNTPPLRLAYPQHLLIIIDLNGTLLYRPSRREPTKFITRPFAQQFLQYCVDTFTVVIWSSARADNVQNMCNTMLTDKLREGVVAIWGREKFGLTPEDYHKRVQCYKRLTKIWNDPTIMRSHPEFSQGARWDQTNTVLVDDSLEKGRSEPHNLIEIPEFYGNVDEGGRILPQVHDFLNVLSVHSNVSACLKAMPFRVLASSIDPP